MRAANHVSAGTPGSAREILAVLESQARLGTWILDLETRSLKWSLGLYAIFETSPKDISPSFDHVLELVHPDDRDVVARHFQSLLDGEVRERRYRIITPSGRTLWLACSTRPLTQSGSGYTHIVGMVADITDRVVAAEREARWARRADALAAALGGTTWFAGADGGGFENRAWRRITGQSLAEFAGWGRIEAIHPDYRQAFVDGWAEAFRTGGRYLASYRVRTVAGTYARYTAIGLPLHDETGAIVEWCGHLVPDPAGLKAMALADDTGPGNLAPSGRALRGARALLGWSAEEAAERSGVSVSTVRRVEGDDDGSSRRAPRLALRRAMERSGIRFHPVPGGGTLLGFEPEDEVARAGR